MPKLGFINTHQSSRLSVGVEPIKNVLNTLFLIADCNEYPGIHPFVTQTHDRLDQKTKQLHETISIGLCHAAVSERQFPNFQAYIQDLKQINPEKFSDRVFESYDRTSAYKVGIISDSNEVTVTKKDQERLLSSKAIYLEYLKKCFGHEVLDLDIEARAYDLLVEPEKLKATMIDHFQYMWDTFLQEEFEKNENLLFKAASEYNQLQLNSLDTLEAVKRVTGHDLEQEWANKKWEIEWIRKSDHIVFVPSFHMGPYLGRKFLRKAAYIYFSPRIIDGFSPSSQELTRTDIGMRLTTLGDDVRLQILKMLTKEPELSSKQIMDSLNLTQSSASRHLQQLSVNGFINERRQHSAKVYSLNKSYVSQTLEAVSSYLKITSA
ncbi:MAG: winged helix-turn-helix transcriptional regulator [Desulfobacteraceae bacterium]|nr:winged helix-turn-helix transcriptional regulator [Desulfobacteraceae bacterium]